MPYQQPSYLTAFQNAAQAYLSGLQEKEARDREDSLRREQDERLKQNFLRDMMYQQAREGNAASAKYLDKTMGMESTLPDEVPATAGPILSRRGSLSAPTFVNKAVANPPAPDQRALTSAQNKLYNSLQGFTNVSPEMEEANRLLHGELEEAQKAVGAAKTFKDREAAIQNYNQVAQRVQQRMQALRATGKLSSVQNLTNVSPEIEEANRLLLENAGKAVRSAITVEDREAAIRNYSQIERNIQQRMQALKATGRLPAAIPHVLPNQFAPEELQALQARQRQLTEPLPFGQSVGTTRRSVEEISPTPPPAAPTGVLAGPFERYAAEQKAKMDKADRDKQLQLKRASDEKYFEDIDRAILEGRVSPGDATKYFAAKRDYVTGKTQELPTINLREKAQDKQDRTDAVRNRRTNMLLMATSRLDDKIGGINSEISKIEAQWNKLTNESPDRADVFAESYIKRKRELEKDKEKLAKRRADLEKSLDAVMQEEGIPTFGADENNFGEDIKKKGAESLYNQLLSMGVDEQSARDRVIANYDYDPIAGESVSKEERTPGETYQPSAPQTGGQQSNARVAKAKALLDEQGYISDPASIEIFLKNNPNF